RKIVGLLFGNVGYSQWHGRTFNGGPVNDFWFPITLVHSYLCEKITFSARRAQGQLRNDCPFAKKELFPDTPIKDDLFAMIPTRNEAWQWVCEYTESESLELKSVKKKWKDKASASEFFLKANLTLKSVTTSSVIPVKPCNYRFARRSDLQILRPDLRAGAWSHLSRLLQFSCTKPEWIILGFKAGALADTWVLAAPSEFNLPLEIIRLHAGLNGRPEALRSFQVAIEKAKIL